MFPSSYVNRELSPRQFETLIAITRRVPLCPKRKSVEDIETEVRNYSTTTVFEYLRVLTKLGLAQREKRQGGVYYYCLVAENRRVALKKVRDLAKVKASR